LENPKFLNENKNFLHPEIFEFIKRKVEEAEQELK